LLESKHTLKMANFSFGSWSKIICIC
jgi:hypothetical protein